MHSYVQPSKVLNNDLVILHCGTNDLRTEKQPLEIANEIMDLASEMKTNINEVMVSGIVQRRDKLNGKQVNQLLQSSCISKKFHFIDNSNINPEYHLNNSGLHLNTRGTYTLGSNFVSENELNIESTPIESNEIMDKSSHILSKFKRAKDNVIIAHLNINFLRNKFEPLAKLVQGKIDILIISETKIDESFTSNQFMIDGYSTPFREHRNSHGGGVLIYAREDIPCKRLKSDKASGDIEGILIKLNINENKWFLMGDYNPNNESTSYFFSHVSKVIDLYLKYYFNW